MYLPFWALLALLFGAVVGGWHGSRSLVAKIDSSRVYSDIWTYKISARSFYFDTTAAKCGARPDLNEETAFRKPEFKRFFGLSDNYTVGALTNISIDLLCLTKAYLLKERIW
ncbi:MAG: hypothetical protein IPL33_16830 [Sphingobacteriales bacterium]|nr:hypothetical protein [Sphingobacteriales bacterium]